MNRRDEWEYRNSGEYDERYRGQQPANPCVVESVRLDADDKAKELERRVEK